MMRGHKAEQYDRLSRLLLRWLYRTVAADAAPAAGEAGTVVDIGTGPGRLPVELARVLRPGGKLRIYDIRGETLAELAAGPLPASIALSPPQGRRMVGLALKAVVATLRAEKASEASPT